MDPDPICHRDANAHAVRGGDGDSGAGSGAAGDSGCFADGRAVTGSNDVSNNPADTDGSGASD